MVLFTVLISSIVLLISLGIANISVNEIALSSAGKEAQYAFFAADTGGECALYWDKLGIFPDPSVVSLVTPPPAPWQCAGNSIKGLTANPPYNFSFDLNGLYCVQISVGKSVSVAGDTQIVSKGYNVPCGQISVGKAVERAVKLSY